MKRSFNESMPISCHGSLPPKSMLLAADEQTGSGSANNGNEMRAPGTARIEEHMLMAVMAGVMARACGQHDTTSAASVDSAHAPHTQQQQQQWYQQEQQQQQPAHHVRGSLRAGARARTAMGFAFQRLGADAPNEQQRLQFRLPAAHDTARGVASMFFETAEAPPQRPARAPPVFPSASGAAHLGPGPGLPPPAIARAQPYHDSASSQHSPSVPSPSMDTGLMPSSGPDTPTGGPTGRAAHASGSQHQFCPICDRSSHKPIKSICNVCYSGVYNDILKWIDRQQRAIDPSYTLEAFVEDLKTMPRGCERQYTCGKESFKFDQSQLLRRKIADFNRQLSPDMPDDDEHEG
ncbi:hypothetical protein PTSG_05628 [Salpingoeca rosetta]|uniref:Uncharacterized protein n=1 Tax=Salpingoeca rosetta (strain ATCC 50818 / BSB-021) TaxID=946362 RepID=F2UBR7_SALR5|nr:uncharacterized protein PTSG_05628 [Salpingoeca rosetta]EGD73933.1 hypothetical protein PTSG_05628 [Salpingoeca rosetta]|eukprot:XP_004993496.1 hypothetical protein PTSG_05628 [Salpingoeca rosetta]